MDVGVVGDGVVFFDEILDVWVGDGVGEVWKFGRHDGLVSREASSFAGVVIA